MVNLEKCVKIHTMKQKRRVYIFLTIILGIILSYIVHAGVELLYLKVAGFENVTWYMHWGFAPCSLPPFVAYSILLIGIIGGYFLGRFWWQLVYVEKKHWRFKNKEQLNKQQ